MEFQQPHSEDNRMIDENCVHLRARRNNVRRYRRLLQTELTELERRYIERRLNEEKSAMESLTSSTAPPSNPEPIPKFISCKKKLTGVNRRGPYLQNEPAA
jgi:hypothetical protein